MIGFAKPQMAGHSPLTLTGLISTDTSRGERSELEMEARQRFNNYAHLVKEAQFLLPEDHRSIKKRIRDRL